MAFDPDEWRLATDVGSWSAASRTSERFAWTLVFLVGLALALAGLWALVAGGIDPTSGASGALGFVRGYGFVVAALGLLVMGLAAGPYRHYERWAWALLWVVPATMLGVAVVNAAGGGTLWQAHLALAALAAVGLVLPVRQLGRGY